MAFTTVDRSALGESECHSPVLADKSGLQRLDDVLVSFNKPILPDLIDMRANLIRDWEPGMIMMNVPIGEPEQHLNMVLPEKLHNVIGLFEESGIQCQRGGHEADERLPWRYSPMYRYTT